MEISSIDNELLFNQLMMIVASGVALVAIKKLFKSLAKPDDYSLEAMKKQVEFLALQKELKEEDLIKLRKDIDCVIANCCKECDDDIGGSGSGSGGSGSGSGGSGGSGSGSGGSGSGGSGSGGSGSGGSGSGGSGSGGSGSGGSGNRGGQILIPHVIVSSKFDKYKPINLLRHPGSNSIVGEGFHRSGWVEAVASLVPFSNNGGILFDDFIEQNFSAKAYPIVYRQPWVGIFHHPFGIPSFGSKHEKPETYLNRWQFKESAKELKLAIALSEGLAKDLRKVLPCKVIAVKHPTTTHFDEWNPVAYEANKEKRIIQLGVYLRNTQLIYQIPLTMDYVRERLWTKRKWVTSYDKRVETYYRNKRISYKGVVDLPFITASKFDKLLTENLVAMEFEAVSAANGIIDCIARNTPIFVNPKPEVIEYLGINYPLYFTNPDAIPYLFKHHVYRAHEYLLNMDKSDLTPLHFSKTIVKAINEI